MSQSNHHTPIMSEAPTDNSKFNDDIDLLGLFMSILRTWKVWFISVVAVSVLFGGIKAISVLIETPETIYSKPIRLTFPNAHKLLFPSGAKFAYSDIVAPAVVQQVFERNNLASYGLDVADLQRGLSATPYSPTYPLIIERFNLLMSDKKLTPDNIRELRSQLEKEIEQATAGEILISWRISEHHIPKSVAEKVLNDMPALWAEQAIKEKGVLEINASLATANAVNTDLILKEEILIASDILAQKLSLLRANIEELSNFEGSQTITDPKTGMRLVDLGNAIEDLNKYVIRNFTAPIRLQGLSNTPEVSHYYYLDKFNRLKITLDSLQRQADALKESLLSYNKNDQIGQITNNDRNNSPALMTQLNADMLDKLVRLSGDADREKYKQKLNSKWLLLITAIANTQSEIAETELILNALKNSLSKSAKLNPEHAQYLAHAKEKLPTILQQLIDYFAVSERIAKQLRSETIGIKEHLYIPVTDTVMENTASFDLKGTIISWIALMFLTSILVIPGCMIRNALKARAQ